MVRIVDLTQEVYTGMPVYPGHLRTVLFEWVSHEEMRKLLGTGFSYRTCGIMISDHGGTHVDSIEHISTKPGALTIDKIPLEWFYGQAVCLDVSHVKPKTYITKKDLTDSSAKHKLQIEQGDTVLLYTGTTKKLGAWEYLTEYPGLDYEAASWLAEKGARNIGIDAPSIDNPIDKTYPAHRVCGDKDILNTENMTNLEQVVGKRFKIALFPLRLRNCTGSPVRAVAVLEEA